MKRPLKFLIVGCLNTLIGLSCTFIAMAVFDVGYVGANALGYAVGLVNSFLLNRAWTFSHQGPWAASLARWLAVAAIGYLANLAVVIAVHSYLGVNAYLAQISGIFVYTGLTFIGARYFAFAPAIEPPPTDSRSQPLR